MIYLGGIVIDKNVLKIAYAKEAFVKSQLQQPSGIMVLTLSNQLTLRICFIEQFCLF